MCVCVGGWVSVGGWVGECVFVCVSICHGLKVEVNKYINIHTTTCT